MEKITIGQLLAHLRSYGSAVHCEMYGNYENWYSGGISDINTEFFYDRGCAVVYNEYDYQNRRRIYCRIHQTSPDAEIDAVTARWQAEAGERAEKYENPSVTVVSYIVSNGDLPPEKDKFYGFRNYVKKGRIFPADSRVRELSSVDSEIIKAACSPSLENDTGFGIQQAETFLNFDFEYAKEKLKIFGIFDGAALVGMATRSYEEPLDIAWLRDIFIIPGRRGNGFGRALVSTVLSDYPDKKWHYQSAKQNEDSIRLAKSLGFTLEGAGLFVNW